MCAPPGRAEAGAPTVAKVIAAALREPPALCAHVWKTLNAILCCRTPALGSHCYRCADCGRDHVVPHSCRNVAETLPKRCLKAAVQEVYDSACI